MKLIAALVLCVALAEARTMFVAMDQWAEYDSYCILKAEIDDDNLDQAVEAQIYFNLSDTTQASYMRFDAEHDLLYYTEWGLDVWTLDVSVDPPVATQIVPYLSPQMQGLDASPVTGDAYWSGCSYGGDCTIFKVDLDNAADPVPLTTFSPPDAGSAYVLMTDLAVDGATGDAYVSFYWMNETTYVPTSEIWWIIDLLGEPTEPVAIFSEEGAQIMSLAVVPAMQFVTASDTYYSEDSSTAVWYMGYDGADAKKAITGGFDWEGDLDGGWIEDVYYQDSFGFYFTAGFDDSCVVYRATGEHEVECAVTFGDDNVPVKALTL